MSSWVVILVLALLAGCVGGLIDLRTRLDRQQKKLDRMHDHLLKLMERHGVSPFE